MNQTTRVLVVEDDRRVRQAWRGVLSRSGYAVELTGTVTQARRKLAKAYAANQPYHVLILDLILPDGDGATLLDDLERRRPRPGVAVVSGHLDSERVVTLWGKSLIDVPKPVSTETMVAIVERLTSTDPDASSIDRFCEAYELTPKQSRIVKHTALGWSLEEIADDLGCAVSTLKGYWKRIHDKTGLRARREVVSAAWQHRPKP